MDVSQTDSEYSTSSYCVYINVELGNCSASASENSTLLSEESQMDIDQESINVSNTSTMGNADLDQSVVRLIERTRQRREMLNEKLGKTPDPAPRKRAVPLSENTSSNISVDDDSPKRHCSRESTECIKADTPAITGVKSRLAKLKECRADWSDVSDSAYKKASSHLRKNASRSVVIVESSTPVPVPRKSLSSPPGDPHPPSMSTSGKGGRFAKLASAINNWEDDLSHPIISKPEEKKLKWQAPTAPVNENVPGHSHKTTKAPEPPNQRVPPSPKKNRAPSPPPLPTNLNKPSPLKSSNMDLKPAKVSNINLQKAATKPSTVKPVPKMGTTMSSPLRTPQHSKSCLQSDDIPVNAKGLNESFSEQTDDEPTAKPVSERFAKWAKKTEAGTPKVDDPTQTPVSARMASWQQKTSNPTKSTPVVSATKLKPLAKQMCTPATQTSTTQCNTDKADAIVDNRTVHKTTADDPASLPVSSRMASWQQKAAKPKQEEEPTAYPVLARMSAWEQMSSSNQVAHIKKVNPAPVASPPKPSHPIALGAVVASSNKLTQKPSASPKNTKTLTPSKSFVESIQERAAQINSPSRKSPVSPEKTLSPAKVSCTMKSVQQRLMEQTQSSDKSHDMVDKIRQERMAELNVIQNRWKNGILNTDGERKESNQNVPPPPPVPASPPGKVNSTNTMADKSRKNEPREAIKAKARAESDVEMEDIDAVDCNSNLTSTDISPSTKIEVGTENIITATDIKPDFDQKLTAMGFDIADPESPVATFHFKKDQKTGKSETDDNTSKSAPVTNKPPPAPASLVNKTGSNSIYGLISKNKTESESIKPIDKFHDSFDSDTDDQSDRKALPRHCETDDTEPTTESEDDMVEESTEDSDYPQPVRRQAPVHEFYDDGDDVSLSAFVPASVRRESILPHEGKSRHSMASETSIDSFDDISVAGQDHGRGQYASNSVNQATCSMTSVTSVDSEDHAYQDDDSDDKADIDDLLDEAMDSDDDSDYPVAAPRKRRNDKSSGEEPTSPLIYSVSMYRSKRYNEKPPPAKMKIIRNSDYTDSNVEEEDIRMPEQPPPPSSRKSRQETIRELQELVQHEQNIIMQTSNALNQCCSGNSAFVGSTEQVECNRLLLIACQKRQAYLTEIQRLKDTGRLDDTGSGPKGSLTISDIRLPLKKEFVTKIGTTQDTITYYFVLLIHNGPQLIFTQMLSTHDPMMRGSLDFPNLIKINGIGGNFKLDLEIYGMSVSKEYAGKDKKKKTPKKTKSGLPLQSPGGPMAVRTTSFSLITSLSVNMKSLDKSSFNLERLPYLSPLHGTIYMKLKCLMEANVEERGFLTMFEDVSGLGAWHRRWVVLAQNKLGYWKYPDDETRKEPIGFIDLKRCITEKIGLIPRDICARPNTFELVTVRQPRKGEQDTLITKTYNTMTTVKTMLSADTKEERIVWCNKINRALANIRTWHSDAMRPIK